MPDEPPKTVAALLVLKPANPRSPLVSAGAMDRHCAAGANSRPVVAAISRGIAIARAISRIAVPCAISRIAVSVELWRNLGDDV
jgi:hypothetical protein